MDAEEKAVGIITDRVAEVTCGQCGCEIDVADLEPFVRVECPDCGNIEVAPSRLGQFLLLDRMGTGGMGGVYYAKDESLGRFVAIKVMLKSLGENKEFVENFRREAQAVAKLNHPNIVQIYSFGQEKGQPYIVMELVPGKRFDKMVEGEKQLDQVVVMQVGLDIAEGLRAADEVGLIHGDIKPENILLDEKEQAKLVDFGLATFANRAAAKGIWGTPYYIAPEKVRRRKADARSDIYSLGATLYHALAGRPPFEGETPVEVVKARLEQSPTELHLIRPDIHSDVEGIISRMLQAEPAMRYPTYASLTSDMRKALEKLAPGKSYADRIGGKAKRMVITKKKTSLTSIAAAPPEKARADQQPPRTGRFVIHKGKAAASTSPAISEDKKQPADTSQAPEKGKKKRKKIFKAVLWITLIILLILAGVGLGLYLKDKKDKEIETRREAFAVAKQIKNAEETYEKIRLAVTNVITMAATAQSYVEKATNAVYVVLGEGLDESEPEAKEVQPPKESAPSPPPTAKRALDDSGAPPGMLSPEEVERKRQKKSIPAPDKSEKPADKPKKSVERPVEPIKILARKVVSEAKEISQKAEDAREIGAAALIARNEAVNADSSSTAADMVKELSGHLTSVQIIQDEAKEALQNAEKAVQKVEAIKLTIGKEKEARRKAEEEKARQRAEEEARERMEAQHKALVENELNLAETARSSSLPLIKQHKYKEALDSLTRQLSAYETDEGKNAVKILIDRYSRLQKLKMFIIERLNAEPFRWGWLGKEDVLAADETGVKLKARTVPWAEVGLVQMKKFIDYCLSHAGKNVRLRVLGEQNLAAAIFCYENGGTQAAASYAEKAVELCPHLQKEVTRLLPLE